MALTQLSEKLNITPTILFFIASNAPTVAEALAAESLDFPVKFRNASEAKPGQFEDCDGVLGEVPESYEFYPKGHRLEGKRIPDGSKFMAAFKKARLDALKAKGEELSEFEKAQADAKAKAADAKAKKGDDKKPDDKKPENWGGGDKQ